MTQPTISLALRASITRTTEWCNFHFLDLPGSVDTGDAHTIVVVDAFWPLGNDGRFSMILHLLDGKFWHDALEGHTAYDGGNGVCF